jgi:hypothetical protein
MHGEQPAPHLCRQRSLSCRRPWPALLYLNIPIWTSRDKWNASAPFLDRYEITGNGDVTIILDELNWWPLVYSVKCKFLIRSDALLTGPMNC